MGISDAIKCLVICLAAFLSWVAGQAGFAVGLAGLFLTAVRVAASVNRRRALTNAMSVWLCAVLSCVLLGPAVSWAREGARRTQCRNNLKQISLALYNYHNAFGSLPPAWIADENGTPMHSWRVLLLPFIEEQRLFEQYDFSEPWNGPKNRALADRMPELYWCPSDQPRHGDSTNYVAVVGPDTAWPGDTATSWSDFRDGKQGTILLVEVANSGIHWMEPRDLLLNKTPLQINSKSGQAISSRHILPRGILHREIGANVVLADGDVRFLPEKLNGVTLAAMLTRAGGDTIDLQSISPAEVDPARITTLWLLSLSVVVFLAVIHWQLRPSGRATK